MVSGRDLLLWTMMKGPSRASRLGQRRQGGAQLGLKKNEVVIKFHE